MAQEEKQLLLKDLCARLPYGVLCYINDDDTSTPRKLSRIEVDELDGILLDFWTGREDCPFMQVYLSEVKPYLRPMSSMTDEEYAEYVRLVHEGYAHDTVDYLNSIHVDYRGLIQRGLAIKVTEENNSYKE